MRLFNKISTVRILYIVIVMSMILVLLPLIGCGSESEEQKSDQQDQDLFNTQVALAIQQTAIQQTATAQKEREISQATIDFQQTQINQAPTDTVVPPTQPPVSMTDTSQPTAIPPTPPPQEDFDEWVKSASILLYDDMIRYKTTFRFSTKTLDEMGLSYVDVGDAKGLLKEQLLYQAPPGGWDLIIIAAESKTGFQGEFFSYTYDALQDGSSVILEVWYLDSVGKGTAIKLLELCGIEYEGDWAMIPPKNQIMWPLNDSHPVMRVPNTITRLTDVTSFWGYKWDIGDLMKVPPGSDAQLLVGLSSGRDQVHGTVTVCVDDRLILQTFSSHQLTWDVMRLVWENYIYNALRARYDYLH